jgi:hypothetical protein
MKLAAIAVTCLFFAEAAYAIDHPACAGKDNNLCDTLGALVNLKGKGCYRLLNVTPLGKDAYRLTCELASYDRSSVTYTLRFIDGRKNYTVE